MNLEPFNGKSEARYHNAVGGTTIIAADAMKSIVVRRGKYFGSGRHFINLYLKGEKIAHILLDVGEAIDLFDYQGTLIDTALEPAFRISETRIKAKSYDFQKGAMFGMGLESIDGTLYGRHANGDPITDREAAGKPAFVKTAATGDDKCNSAIPQTPQPEVRFIYFCNRGEASSHSEIREAFRKFGASVEIVNMEGRPSWTLKL